MRLKVKNKNILRMIFLILILATFSIIFCFSSQDGNKSKSVSKQVMRTIVEVNPKTNKLNETEKEDVVEKSQPVIRKLAHFTIYMLTGILIMGFLSTYDFHWKKKLTITLILGILYAISDEIHQLFTGGGRTARIFDVFIDFLGVFIGACFVLVILKLIKKIYK